MFYCLMRSECTLFHGKQTKFEGGEAKINSYFLRGRKLLPLTVVALGNEPILTGQSYHEQEKSGVYRRRIGPQLENSGKIVGRGLRVK